MAVMATDAPSATNNSKNETTAPSRSPSEGGFTPEWSQEADNRLAERRHRAQQVPVEQSAPRIPTTQPQPISDVDDDEDERKRSLNKMYSRMSKC